MTGPPDSDRGTGPGGGEKWSDSESVLGVEQQDEGQIGVSDQREKGIKDESKVFRKMDLLSGEVGRTAREQVEMSGAWF